MQKHGIAFDDAARVFADRFYLERADEREDYGEERTQVIGEVDGTLLLVVCTQRGERCRIISARTALRHERRIYDKNKTAP